MPVLEELRQAVVDGQAKAAVARATQGLEEGIPAEVLLRDGLISAMQEVGRLFEEGEIFVPEMLVSARAMNATLVVLKPLLATEGSEARSEGKVVIGTVQGDLHEIGKNLVAIMLEGSGFEVVDLGTDVSPERFLEAAEAGADVVAMSALLTTTMTNMKAVVEALGRAGLRDKVRIIVGGAPITDRFASEIGADGYAPDASKAVRKVRELLAVKA
jgi:5-methyltetrahydrofolate--homocysteine methyltransferase